MIENEKYFVSQINSSKAFKMTSLYHYSGVGFKKAILNLGIFRKEDNLLVGVLQWGCSFQEKIRLDRYVKEPIKKEEYLELNRFCMADSEGKNSESQAISLGIKWIKKNRPDIKLLVSYAGRKEGNYGYIYQATNWEYLGYFVSSGFWSIDGIEKHMMTLWCEYKKNGTGKEKNMNEYLVNTYQDVRQTWTKQFIYIQRLDKTLTPATEPMQYPKVETDGPIKIKEKIIKQNDEIYNNPIREKREKVEYYYEEDKYLFSRATLIRRGELESNKRNREILIFNSHGNYETSMTTKKDADALGLNITSARKALREGKFYKNKFFAFRDQYDDVPEEIEVPYVCIIDEISFSTYTEAAEYLGVSKQAVQQAKSRHSKKIMDKEIIWD